MPSQDMEYCTDLPPHPVGSPPDRGKIPATHQRCPPNKERGVKMGVVTAGLLPACSHNPGILDPRPGPHRRWGPPDPFRG